LLRLWGCAFAHRLLAPTHTKKLAAAAASDKDDAIRGAMELYKVATDACTVAPQRELIF
jgi:hypothetical protein